MILNRVAVFLLTIFYLLESYHCVVDLVPERPEITYLNHKYIKYAKFYLTRYGRKSAYYANIYGEIMYPWGNNATIHVIFYERLSNQYKRSFFEFKRPMCDLVEKDIYLGKLIKETLAKAGIDKCPFVPGPVYRMMNMTLLNIPFPYKMPFTNVKVELTMYGTHTNETLAIGHCYFTIKQKN